MQDNNITLCFAQHGASFWHPRSGQWGWSGQPWLKPKGHFLRLCRRLVCQHIIQIYFTDDLLVKKKKYLYITIHMLFMYKTTKSQQVTCNEFMMAQTWLKNMMQKITTHHWRTWLQNRHHIFLYNDQKIGWLVHKKKKITAQRSNNCVCVYTKFVCPIYTYICVCVCAHTHLSKCILCGEGLNGYVGVHACMRTRVHLLYSLCISLPVKTPGAIRWNCFPMPTKVMAFCQRVSHCSVPTS